MPDIKENIFINLYEFMYLFSELINYIAAIVSSEILTLIKKYIRYGWSTSAIYSIIEVILFCTFATGIVIFGSHWMLQSG